MSDYEQEVNAGFGIMCEAIAWFVNWAFYIIFFPLSYPLALLGRRKKARIQRANEAAKERYRQAMLEPSILISCHHRIEEREGYDAYKAAKARGDKTVSVRFLGSGDTERIDIGLLNPCHFEKQ